MSKKNSKYNEIPVKNDIINAEVEEVVTEKKSLERVVNAPPVKVKRSLIGRLVSGIVGPEGVSGIGEYVNEEIIKPAIKNIIVDAVTSGINMVMYGERGGRNTGGYRPTGGYQRTNYQSSYQRTNYTSRYTQHNPEPAPTPREPRNRHLVEEYVLNDRHDASHVLVSLTENADAYGSVSVADYYELIGVASTYTDNNYGWTIDSISRATIIGVRGGYVIKFPPLEVL